MKINRVKLFAFGYVRYFMTKPCLFPFCITAFGDG